MFLIRRGILAACVALSGPAAAADLLSVEAEAAFSGWVRRAAPSAVAVRVDNRGPDWSGALVLVLGDNRIERRLEVAGGARKLVWLPLAEGGDDSKRFVHLLGRRGDPVAADFKVQQLGPNDSVAALVSDRGMFFGGLLRATSPTGPGNLRLPFLSTAELPAHRAAYGSVDAVFASDWDPASVSAEQAGALGSWVAEGGLLVVGAEPDQAKLRTPWLAELLPARQGADAELSARAALERHTGRAYDRRDPEPWTAALSPLPGARVLLADAAERPLVVCRPRGLGTVCLSAFGMTDRSLGSYDGWAQFALELIGSLGAPAPEINESRAASSAMARHLDELIKQISEGDRHPAGIFAMFAVVYVLILVPGNFLYLRRVGQPERYWQAMLSVVAVFSVLAWGVGALHRPGDAARALWVYESAPGLDRARLTGYAGILSSARRTRDFELPASVESIEESFPNAGQASPAGSAWELAQEEARARLAMPLEIGQMRFFELHGQRSFAGPMQLSWDGEGDGAELPPLRWENRTGINFSRLALLTSPLFASSTGAPAPKDGSGRLPGGKGKAAPIDAVLGSELAKDYGAMIRSLAQRRAASGALLVLGVAEGESAASRDLRSREIYLWSIPSPLGRGRSRRHFLELEPSARNWYLSGTQLVLQSGEVVLQHPAPAFARLGSSDAQLQVRLQGQWAKEPELEAFDFEAGRWVSDAGAKPPDATGLRLGDAASARLAAHVGGMVRVARVLRDGAVEVDRIAVAHGAEPQKLGFVRLGGPRADPAQAPALAIDALHRTHLVYGGRDGKLYHGVERGEGQWAVALIADSDGGRQPALRAAGANLHLALRDLKRGVRYGAYSGERWSLATVDPSAGPMGPVAVDAAPATGPRVAYARGTAVQLASQRYAGWDIETVGHGSGAAAALTLDYGSGRTQLVLADNGPGASGQLRRWSRYESAGAKPVGGWSSHAIYTGLIAGVASLVDYGRYPYAGQGAAAYLTPGGDVRLLGGDGVTRKVPIEAGAAPFDCSPGPFGHSYWLLGGAKGMRLVRIQEDLTAAAGRPGGSADRVAAFPRARRFLWEPAGLVRLRLKTGSPARVNAVEARPLP